MRVRAAVLRAPGEALRVEDVDLEAPHAGEVLVRVEAAGVCHTELHYMDGAIPCPLPIVLGHEGSGVVEEVGAGVGADPGAVAVGDRVAFTWRPRCGHCEYCVTGRPVMCVYGRVQARSGGLLDGTSRLRLDGGPLHHFLGVSCFAERAVVSQRAVVKVPEGVEPAVAAVTGCAVITGVGAVVNVAGQVAGKPIVVVGAGGVGLSALMGAVLVGAVPVVVDVAADKLELARRLGAADTLDASGMAPDDVVAAVQELTGGGAEVAVDAVGLPQTLRQAFAVLRPGGTAIAVGLGAVDATASVPINELVQQQKRLVGSLYGSANPPVDLPRILGLYLAGRLPLDVLLGERHPLDGVDDAYRALRAGSTGRAVVLPA
jgi:S-(hydroxymethyl)glutathione dehydrogenase / alcohol dehydrogenase